MAANSYTFLMTIRYGIIQLQLYMAALHMHTAVI